MPIDSRSGLIEARRMVILFRQGAGLEAGADDMSRLAREAASPAGEREIILIPETGGGPKPAEGDIPRAQAAAALARSRTALIFQEAFERRERPLAALSLAMADLASRERRLHVRNTLFGLLRIGAVPLVFLNETTSREGLRPGEAADLAAHLAPALDAELLLVLEAGEPRPGSLKEAWEKAAGSGIPVLVCPYPATGGLEEILSGSPGGNFYKPGEVPFDPSYWEALTLASRGALVVDRGYAGELCQGRKPLAPEHVLEVRGRFGPGAQVNLVDRDGNILAVGLCNYSSAELGSLKTLKADDIKRELGYIYYRYAVGGDNIILPRGEGGSVCLLKRPRA